MEAPCQVLTCLGIEFDMNQQIIHISSLKLSEILELCAQWADKLKLFGLFNIDINRSCFDLLVLTLLGDDLLSKVLLRATGDPMTQDRHYSDIRVTMYPPDPALILG